MKQNGAGRGKLMEFDQSTTLDNVKNQINEKMGNSPGNHWFIYAGQVLDDLKTLSECGVTNCSVLHVVLEARED